jgi:hypothetical protein
MIIHQPEADREAEDIEAVEIKADIWEPSNERNEWNSGCLSNWHNRFPHNEEGWIGPRSH